MAYVYSHVQFGPPGIGTLLNDMQSHGRHICETLVDKFLISQNKAIAWKRRQRSEKRFLLIVDRYIAHPGWKIRQRASLLHGRVLQRPGFAS